MKVKLLTMVAFLAPGAVLAGTPINETRSVDDDVRIDVSNVKGAVNVTAWEKNEVSISGTLGDGAKRLAVDGEGGHLSVKVEGPDKSKGWLNWGSDSSMEESVLNLKVPRKASIEINVVSAAVVVADLDGGDVQIDSVSGRVRVGAQSRRLRVENVSGDVEFDGKAAEAEVQTVSGDVRVRGVGGRTRFETVSGAVRVVASAPLTDTSAGTVSGDIEINGELAKGGRMHVETMSGDVRIGFASNVSARIQAESFSGTLRSDFGTVEKREHGPGSSLDARVGDGEGDVDIDSFSGDVTLRRE
ncbi:MAG TPA: DUF4097 family beta strand repeat-containing protein [Tahibacter sp.]|nr:DUF4097 family beta strand repeat-containing protein [Tahibacter sp.]